MAAAAFAPRLRPPEHDRRLRDGSRRVTHCSEITGMEGQVVTMQDIFVFDQHGVDENGKVVGGLRSTGLRPKFAERLTAKGVALPPNLFDPQKVYEC